QINRRQMSSILPAHLFRLLVAATALSASIALSVSLGDQNHQQDYSVRPVPFNEVSLTDDFWRPRLITERQTLVPFALNQTKVGLADLQAAADFLAGKGLERDRGERFRISDLFKVVEGTAYLLHDNRDPELEAQIDNIVTVIAAAQEPDGYLYPAHTM